MSRGPRVARAVLFSVLVALAGVVGAEGAGADAAPVAQACGSRAVVVVDTASGVHQTTICFDGTISGLDALQLAGANPVTYGFSGQGAAVCQLYGVGNPPDSSCLIGPGGAYWAYYRAAPGATGWSYSRGGATSTTVTDGSVEGWRYGTGAAPPFSSFCSVVGCAPPPTAAPPPAAGGGSSNPDSGTASPGAPTGGVTSSEGVGGPSTPAGSSDGDTANTTTTAPTAGPSSASSARSGRDQGKRDTESVALGSAGGGGDDSGSPLGVLIVAIVLAAGAATAAFVRRRRRGPTTS
jgi:hypothetical protein